MTKILLVEDDKSLREIYGVRLLAEGYDIVSAGDGEEALAMAIKDRPALILSDVMMPKISGFDMLDILRSTTETKGIKVIMMTALSSEDQRKRGEQLGADKYLVKSQVGIEDVVRAVHEVLGDAPVSGGSPSDFMTPGPSAAPRPAPTTTAPPRPAAPMPAPTAPQSVPPASPSPAAPAPLPQPTASGMPANDAVKPPMPSPAPTPSGSMTPAPEPSTSLPQPTAPFSTPRPASLAERVIQPVNNVSGPSPDLAAQIDKELDDTPAGGPLTPPSPSDDVPKPADTPTPTPPASGPTPPPASPPFPPAS